MILSTPELNYRGGSGDIILYPGPGGGFRSWLNFLFVRRGSFGREGIVVFLLLVWGRPPGLDAWRVGGWGRIGTGSRPGGLSHNLKVEEVGGEGVVRFGELTADGRGWMRRLKTNPLALIGVHPRFGLFASVCPEGAI